MIRRRSDQMPRAVLCGLAAAGILVGCGSSNEPVVDVLAASSFTDVADDLEVLLESELDVDIRFSFGSSGTFVEQLDQGSPAAVVIAADEMAMQRIEDAGLVDASVAITRNELIIVTADDEVGRSINSLADLAASSDAVVVVCTSSAPCGAATDQLLEQSGLTLNPASREPNVRATLTKVILGEADAAIVYRTDARSRPDLRAVEIADTVAVVGRAAAVTGENDGDRVVDVLTGPAAAAVLADAGFLAP